MQDVDDIRAALGYDLIDLWGGSYGTRAALVYLREHGTHVRALILDGVAPMQLVLPVSLARDADRALHLLFKECAANAACDRAFPQLRERFEKFLAELKTTPAKVTVAHPLTGMPTQLTISHELFVESLRGQLYLPDVTALMPYTLDHVLHGDWGPFVAQNAGLEGSFVKGMYIGLLFATTCAEDLPYTSDEELDNAARGTFLGATFAHTWKKVCGVFPPASLKPRFREAVRSDKPVLLVSGELDPVTPPSWAEEARRTLPNSVHVVLPGIGHGATPYGCVPKIVQRFLNAGTVANLDTSCATKTQRPPFFITFAGPSP
jgi:pimeloyl-ACP methyl ester carboxylesterase